MTGLHMLLLYLPLGVLCPEHWQRQHQGVRMDLAAHAAAEGVPAAAVHAVAAALCEIVPLLIDSAIDRFGPAERQQQWPTTHH